MVQTEKENKIRKANIKQIMLIWAELDKIGAASLLVGDT